MIQALLMGAQLLGGLTQGGPQGVQGAQGGGQLPVGDLMGSLTSQLFGGAINSLLGLIQPKK